MIRWSLSLSLAMILTAGAAAQDKQLRDPDKKPEEPKKLAPDKKPDGDKKPKPGDGDDEEAKILERLTRNSKSAEERLGRPDTGDETRRLQNDVLKDINELIKRIKNPPPPPQQDQNQSDPMGGGGGSKAEQAKGSPAEQGGNEQGFKRQSGLTREQRRQQREQRRQQQAKSGGQGSGQQPQQGKNPGGQQPMGGNQQANNNGGKGGPGGNSAGTDGGGGGRDPKGTNPAAEMYKDTWGHLPEKMRQEMDSYFKEKFMPKYNDLLKQYYSNIAEQNKKK
jgi:hypothetical protein